jgi:hypothetical protein
VAGVHQPRHKPVWMQSWQNVCIQPYASQNYKPLANANRGLAHRQSHYYLSMVPYDCTRRSSAIPPSPLSNQLFSPVTIAQPDCMETAHGHRKELG